MTKRACWIGAVFLWCVWGPLSPYAQVSQRSMQDSVLNTALWSLGLTQADLTIRGDTLGDVDRLQITQDLLEAPIQTMALLPKFEGLTSTALLKDVMHLLTNKSSVDLLSVDGEDVPNLDALVDALVHCHGQLDLVFDGYSAAERERLVSLIQLVDPEVSLSENASDSLLALGRRVDVKMLVQTAFELMQHLDTFVTADPMLQVGVFDTPVGRVIVGGEGPDVYAESAVLIIDLGGDDRYVSRAGDAGLSVVIDFDGNDLYEGCVGGGLAGIQVVIDIAGHDRYISAGMGQGVGVGGVGILADLAGEDRYQVGLGGQGFGLFGVGILYDGEGADRYAGHLLVQGVGAPSGVGILADISGADVYQAGGKFADFREPDQFYQSMAQGFGYGIRSLASGGVGVLIDVAGDDRYEVDYFGQGTGFWGSVGVLIDRQGSDHYLARRYAQGCGVHLAVGVLLDVLGDDVYTLWGVGQGCGHDLAVGRLLDKRGDDTYRATWLAQGVGHANGIGWLDDFGGDDLYEAEREDTQGYGVSARDYGSIGLLLDRMGHDTYRLGKQQGLVRISGDYGVGVDWPVLPTGEVR